MHVCRYTLLFSRGWDGVEVKGILIFGDGVWSIDIGLGFSGAGTDALGGWMGFYGVI